MISLRARIVNRLLPLTGTKTFFSNPSEVQAKIEKLRQKGPDLPSKRFKRKFEVLEEQVDGYRVFTIAPRAGGRKSDHHVLYLHGGGYVMDISWAHWNFIGRLVDATGASVTAPIYPLAPEQKCEKLIPQMQGLFGQLAEKHGAANMTVMGDSAGGGLSLAVAHSLRDNGHSQPARLILLSPWLDVTATHPDQPEIEKRDPMISISGLRKFGELYAGHLDAKDPRVSPLFGSHKGLPPMQIFTGSADVLLPDAQRFRTALERVDGNFEYHEYSKMFHVWMLIPIPEGKKVMGQVSSFILQTS
ncbi:alpha/beta hydrolase fold domain-containing protein [Sphingorhabdus sp. Alg231-15]|uniref:alpha/beta hydrolase fold domain-containing protein n=1 Tax=Sphingorhabdus sp. Alg231-15 TaxID=1922222 RepID=UPI000D551468